MNPIAKLYTKINEAGLWEKDIVLKRNEYLKVSGTVDTNLYYLELGSLRIFMLDDYEEHTIRFGYAGNFITVLDSFITENPSDLYIQTLKKTRLRVIGKSSYIKLMNQNEENKALWNQILEQLVLQQLEREKDILTSSPKERYKRVLQRSPKLFQEIPNKHIASYLRMTPETLSRLKKS